MGMHYYFFIYFACLCYISIPIYKIYSNGQQNRDFTFAWLTSYILAFSIPIFYFYFRSLIFTSILTFLLMISTFILIREIKSIFGKYQVLSIPILIFVIYTYSYLLNAIILP